MAIESVNFDVSMKESFSHFRYWKKNGQWRVYDLRTFVTTQIKLSVHFMSNAHGYRI
jgi:hypothetical protein